MKRFLLLCLSILCLFNLAAQNQRLIGLKGSRFCEGDSILAYSLSGDSLIWKSGTRPEEIASSVFIHFDSSGYVHARERISEFDGKECVVNGGMQNGFSDFSTNINRIPSATPRGKMIFDQSSIYGRYQKSGNYYPSDTVIYWLNSIGGDDTLWSQDIQVKPGYVYDFSFWLYRFYYNGLGYFSVYINGSPILKYINGATGRRGYYVYQSEWFAQNDSIARIEFISENNYCLFCMGCPCGGAFGIDDISLKMSRDSLFLDGKSDSAWIEVKQKPFFNSDFWVEDSLYCESQGFELTLSGAMGGILWNDGAQSSTQNVKESGWKSFSALNKDGCPIGDSIWVSINPFNNARISRQGDSLYSSHPGYGHQWTLNDTVQLGNLERIAIVNSGKYHLKLTDNYGCLESVESIFQLNTTSIKRENQFSIKAYPNPSNGVVSVRIPQETDIQQIELIGADGRKMMLDWKWERGEVKLELGHLSDGVYHVRILTSGSYSTSRVQIFHY